MSFFVSKTQPSTTLSEAENYNNNNEYNFTEEQEDPETTLRLSGERVTSHVYLKPAHSSQTLDKEVVLGRIRQRKRVNKVRAAVHGFLGYFAASSKSDKQVPVRWVDDAFAAP